MWSKVGAENEQVEGSRGEFKLKDGVGLIGTHRSNATGKGQKGALQKLTRQRFALSKRVGEEISGAGQLNLATKGRKFAGAGRFILIGQNARSPEARGAHKSFSSCPRQKKFALQQDIYVWFRANWLRT